MEMETQFRCWSGLFWANWINRPLLKLVVEMAGQNLDDKTEGSELTLHALEF